MPKQMRNTYLQVELVDDNLQLSLRELCQDCGVHAETVMRLVEYGVIAPRGHTPGSSPGQWLFVGADLIRVKRAMRLQRDLAVNLAGVALSLELLDEIDALHRRLQHLRPSAD